MVFIIKFQQLFAFLMVIIVVFANYEIGAAFTAEGYWKAMLPNSPMPQIVKDLIHPSSVAIEQGENKDVSVGVGKGGVNVNVPAGKPGGTGTNVHVGHGGVGVRIGGGKHGGGTSVGVGRGGVIVGTPPRKGKPVVVKQGPFEYKYAATETQLKDDPNVALFFLEKDLHTGKKMNLDFSRTSSEATFLPRQIADTIPFSSKRFPEILAKFSVDPDSDEAKVMKETIQECEEKAIVGEKKFCATSLEAMIDFSTSKLGKDVTAMSTSAKGQRKEYHITRVERAPDAEGIVVCHRQEYAYAVFLCHKTSKTVSYKVKMLAIDGSQAEAVAICHRDTAAWNAKHLAFQVLKVQPGTVPVCHFLPEDHIVWVSK